MGDLLALGIDRVEPVDTGLQPTQRLLQRFLEGSADGHHFADRLHLRRQAVVGQRELLEGKARHLGNDVVDRGLERRRRRTAGDVVLQLVERVAAGKLGRHFGDREAGRLRGQRRRARHARIHLDDDHAAIVGIDGELDVGAAGVDADLAQHCDAGVAHDLVFLIGQRLGRRHGDRVAGVHAHGIEVLDRTDDDAVVVLVAHDLHFVFLPAEQRLLDQQFAGRTGFETALADLDEFFLVVGDAAAAAAHSERRSNDGRKAQRRLHLLRLFHAVGNGRARRAEADPGHRLLELLAVLRLVDGLLGGTDHLDAVLLQHAVFGQVERTVERRLAAHGRQHRIRTFLGDDILDHLPGDGLDVGDVGHLRVGHDRRRVGVDQDDAIAFLQAWAPE